MGVFPYNQSVLFLTFFMTMYNVVLTGTFVRSTLFGLRLSVSKIPK